MASASKDTEALASAFDLILPTTYMHATRQIVDRTDLLTQEEQQAAQNMKGHRRAEFATAREMVHQLINVISPLGKSHHASILSDQDGCVLWPSGFIGSISHTRGICSVVVGKQRQGGSIGIDIETRGRLSVASKRRISSPEEQEKVALFAKAHQLHEQDAYTLVFSLKEAFFKYQFPHSRLWLEFQDVEITSLHPDSIDVFAPKLKGGQLPANRSVFYKITQNHVATAVWS